VGGGAIGPNCGKSMAGAMIKEHSSYVKKALYFNI
jgi:hypothetical protein